MTEVNVNAEAQTPDAPPAEEKTRAPRTKKCVAARGLFMEVDGKKVKFAKGEKMKLPTDEYKAMRKAGLVDEDLGEDDD